jgi:osmotically-inducible protein OsmY
VSYGGYGSSGDYGYGARGEYGESQTGLKLPYGQEQAGRGGYTGYGTYGGGNEPAQPPSARQRGPKGYVRSGERICDELHEQLMRIAAIDSRDVSIKVSGATVILEGTVPRRRMRYAIEDLAAGCAGVREVENHIRVVPEP